MITVNLFSESAFTVTGHGVHSAFCDNVEALEAVPSLTLRRNSFSRADVIHVHTVGPLSLIMLTWSAQRRIVTAHITAESLSGSIVGADSLRRAISAYLRWIYNRTDVVVALSTEHAQQLRRAGVTSWIQVVTNFGPKRAANAISRRDARRVLGLPDEIDIILSVGQVQPRKAVHTFHKCAREQGDKLFVWVGGFPFGPLTADYRAMRSMMKAAPANVWHTGVLPRDQVYLYYSAADIYFHPSYHEIAPVAVLEAALAGLPLVLRDLECYRSLFQDAYLASKEEDFSQQIVDLMSCRKLYDEMSCRAQRMASSYNPERTGHELLSIYRTLNG